LRGLAGAGGRDEHEAVSVPQRLKNLRMDLPDRKAFFHVLKWPVPERQRHDSRHEHHSAGHEFLGLDEARGEDREQRDQQDVRDVGLEDDAHRAKAQRDGEGDRHDERDLAFGLEETDEAADDEQDDVDPKDFGCHNCRGM